MLEPWGFPAADLLTAHLASIVASSAGAKDISATDFMLAPALEAGPGPSAEPTTEETADALTQLFGLGACPPMGAS